MRIEIIIDSDAKSPNTTHSQTVFDSKSKTWDEHNSKIELIREAMRWLDTQKENLIRHECLHLLGHNK